MSNSAQLYPQLLSFFRQCSQHRDLRHLKALAWMVIALLCSGKLSLSAWEPYVPCRAQIAQSVERRWQRFLQNHRISVTGIYVPLVLAALRQWSGQRLAGGYVFRGLFDRIGQHTISGCLAADV